MPMPKAMVATTTTGSPERKRSAAARFCVRRQAGVEGDAPAMPLAISEAATRSVFARLPQ